MTSLIGLPIEIVHHIAWELSPRSSESPEDAPQDIQVGLDFACHSQQLTALSRLSRTCKYLRDVVQPILFHSVFDSEETSVSLITTLNARPDLATAVAELEIRGREALSDGDPDESLSPTQQSMVTELVSKNFQIELQDDDRPGTCNVFAALPAVLSPNVKRLLIHVGYWVPPILKPASLPRLRELYLVHRDTELGIHLSRFQSMLDAAPALQTLKCHMVSTVDSAVSHGNLTTLDMQFSLLTNESFPLLIDGLPKLERFSYSSGGALVNDEPEATPREIFEALRQRSSTLKHLSVDLQQAIYMEDLGEQDIIPSLAGMEVLQTLEISALALAVENEPTDGNVLVDALPQSIRSFTLLDPHDTLAEDINRLAEMAAQRFPHLREVAFYDPTNQPRLVPDAPFTSRGIKCTNKSPLS